MSSRLWNQTLLAAPLLGAAAVLCWARDPVALPWVTIAALAVAVAAFAWVLARLGAAEVGAAPTLAVAALLRLLLVPLAPTLSDDVYRYVWDGRVTVAGWNPYYHSPDDPVLVPLRDPLWELTAHREVETVYPPLAIAAFAIASLGADPILDWKLLLVAVDLGSCLLLLRLARRRRVPSGRCLAYAWNPMVALEVAGMGHVDALGVLPLLAAALLLGAGPVTTETRSGAQRAPERRRALRASAAAGAALALAVLVKLVPLLLVPAWTLRARRRLVFVAAGAALGAAAVTPFALGAGSAPPGLVTYAVSWEWNGPVFEPLWRTLDAAEVAPWVKARLDDLKRSTGRHQLWNRFYPYVYPQLLAKLVLGAALLAVLALSLRRRDPVEAALLVFGALLLLSATVYPWYALWVLPWAALRWRPAWLVLSASLLASYLPRLLDIPLLPWPFLSVWGPFVLALVLTRRGRPSPTA